MGLSTPGKAEITSLDSGNIDEVLSKATQFYPLKATSRNSLTFWEKITVCFLPEELDKISVALMLRLCLQYGEAWNFIFIIFDLCKYERIVKKKNPPVSSILPVLCFLKSDFFKNWNYKRFSRNLEQPTTAAKIFTLVWRVWATARLMLSKARPHFDVRQNALCPSAF